MKNLALVFNTGLCAMSGYVVHPGYNNTYMETLALGIDTKHGDITGGRGGGEGVTRVYLLTHSDFPIRRLCHTVSFCYWSIVQDTVQSANHT